MVFENHPCHDGCCPFLLKTHAFSYFHAKKANHHKKKIEGMEMTKNKIRCLANIKEKNQVQTTTRKKYLNENNTTNKS
jgi:hypothetical protein